MNATLNDDRSPLNHAVERLVSEHGFRAVMAALMVRLVRPVPATRAPDIGQLTDHLRRDIGLPPSELKRPVPPIILLTLIR
ncbi:hypothetical protein [Tabrizicola sp.]|uniref:hypothetical protein n=1 Tax=Tabrizicola sp. TaxID=2005166 RepID=UPI003F3E9493